MYFNLPLPLQPFLLSSAGTAFLFMGSFAQTRLPTMTESELSAFEGLIDLPDQELLSWITGEAAVPSTLSNALLSELLKFRP